MTLLTAGYAGTWEVVSQLVGELTAEEQDKILAATAQRVYRLDPNTPEEAACSRASTRS